MQACRDSSVPVSGPVMCGPGSVPTMEYRCSDCLAAWQWPVLRSATLILSHLTSLSHCRFWPLEVMAARRIASASFRCLQPGTVKPRSYLLAVPTTYRISSSLRTLCRLPLRIALDFSAGPSIFPASAPEMDLQERLKRIGTSFLRGRC